MSTLLSIEDLLVRQNSVYAIPINISDADRLMAFSLTISYDSTVFSSPSFGDLITSGSLTTELSLTVNDSVLGLVTISGSGVEPMDAGKGSLATLNLQVRTDATLGSTQIQLISASLNEDNIAASLSIPEIIVLSELKSIESTNSIKYYEAPATANEIIGTNKRNKLKGTRDADLIIGKKGRDRLYGFQGNDYFDGGNGKDIIKGSKGKDYLDGGSGNDVLTGGKGADVFQISRGTDLVKDFSLNQGDRVALDWKGNYTIVDDPDGVFIMANAKKQLFLDGVDYEDIIGAGVDLFVKLV